MSKKTVPTVEIDHPSKPGRKLIVNADSEMAKNAKLKKENVMDEYKPARRRTKPIVEE